MGRQIYWFIGIASERYNATAKTALSHSVSEDHRMLAMDVQEMQQQLQSHSEIMKRIVDGMPRKRRPGSHTKKYTLPTGTQRP